MELVNDAWFARGIGFIHDPVGLQCDALLAIKQTLGDAEIHKAIKTLGVGPLVAHLSSHTALTADGNEATPEQGPSRKWHDAYTLFAASVMVHYADDAEARRALLGSYEKQLEEHRAVAQKERRRQRAKKKEDEKTPT